MDFNSYRTNREKPLFDNGGDIFTYIYSTPPNTVIRYPMKEGNDIVYYGNRPEQRNPAAILDPGRYSYEPGRQYQYQYSPSLGGDPEVDP